MERFSKNRGAIAVGAVAIIVAGVVVWKLSKAQNGKKSNAKRKFEFKTPITIDQVQKEKVDSLFAGGERVYFREVVGQFTSI